MRARIVVVHRLPLRTRFIDVEWLDSVPHRFLSHMKFAVDPVPLVVGMRPEVGARRWREVLVSMTLAHRNLLPEPSGSTGP